MCGKQRVMILCIRITQGITQEGGLDRNKHQEISNISYISEIRKIITHGGIRTRLREIPEFSKKLREAPAKIGRLDTSVS